jgi:hypothetical protein
MDAPQENLSTWFEGQQAGSTFSAQLSPEPLQLPWRVSPENPIAVSRDDGLFFDLVHMEITGARTREVVGGK